MVAAIFGLVGVVIGGVLNGLVTAWLQHRTQHSDGKVSMRLVRGELGLFHNLAKRAASTSIPDLPQFRDADTKLWRTNRSVLARSLDDSQWSRVALAYSYIEALLSLLVFNPDGTLDRWRITEGEKLLRKMIDPIWKALQALGDQAEDKGGPNWERLPDVDLPA